MKPKNATAPIGEQDDDECLDQKPNGPHQALSIVHEVVHDHLSCQGIHRPLPREISSGGCREPFVPKHYRVPAILQELASPLARPHGLRTFGSIHGQRQSNENRSVGIVVQDRRHGRSVIRARSPSVDHVSVRDEASRSIGDCHADAARPQVEPN